MTAGLLDMARCFVVGVPGTGTITFGAAVPDYQTWAAAGAQDGQPYTYRITDGNSWEVGTGTYSAVGPTISRGPLFSSAPGNVAIQVTGQAQVFSTALASSFAVAGSPLTLAGSPDTITNVNTIVVAGGTVTGSGGVGTISGFGGGGGGSYTAGLGIYFTGTSPTTIGTTGTIIQHAASGTSDGKGIMVRAGAPGAYPGLAGGVYGYGASVTQPGTPNVQNGGPVNFYGGNNTITDVAGSGIGGLIAFSGGAVTNASVYASAASFVGSGGEVDGQTVSQGGRMLFNGGNASGATTSSGGGVYFNAGNGDQVGGAIGFYGGTGGTQGGNIIFDPGAGATNGVVLISTIGTVDPAVLGAVWQQSVAAVGYVLMRSQG